MKKILVMPDSFKGTMTSGEVCDIEAKLLGNAFPGCDVIKMPIADGGEGTVDCFMCAIAGEKIFTTVNNAFGEDIEGVYGRSGNTAVIEMASVAGIVSNSRRDPMKASTYGVGQLIEHAINSGCSRIILGLGGSCTNDAGAGMAASLGTEFFNSANEQFVPVGDTLDQVVRIDNSVAEHKVKDIKIECMCDIDNPLYGADGAAFVFAPQKGANEAEVITLDNNLRAFAKTIFREMGIDVSHIAGGGAAGGTGAGAKVFLGAELKQGIDYILDTVDFEEKLTDCDMVITGEGKLDMQSLNGKVVKGIARRAKKKNIPVIAVVGTLSEEFKCRSGKKLLSDIGVSKVYVTSKPDQTFLQIKNRCRSDLQETMQCVIRDIRNSR